MTSRRWESAHFISLKFVLIRPHAKTGQFAANIKVPHSISE
jgi:hypothetical protein